MAQDGSESIADVLEALVAAGLGSVATTGAIDVLARDHAVGASLSPFLPVCSADAPSYGLCQTDVALRREESEEAAIGVTTLRRLSQKPSPQKLGADVSGYEYPG